MKLFTIDARMPWTQFAADAEVDHFGTKRIVAAHNATLNDLAHEKRKLDAALDILAVVDCAKDYRNRQECQKWTEADDEHQVCRECFRVDLSLKAKEVS